MPFPTAWIRWVLPRPTPPYRNSGLYEPPGFSATCIAAARASWFALPVTKVSNVRFGFSRLRSNCSELPETLSTTGPGSVAALSPAPSPFGNRMAVASAEAPSTAKTIATGRWAMRDAACAMRADRVQLQPDRCADRQRGGRLIEVESFQWFDPGRELLRGQLGLEEARAVLPDVLH